GKLKQDGTYQPWRSERCFDWPTPDGTVREYAEDGRLVRESQYKAGELDGIRRVLFRSGKPASEETFAKGQLRKLRCWGNDGQLQLEEEYFDDGSRKSGTPALSRGERAQTGICQPAPRWVGGAGGLQKRVSPPSFPQSRGDSPSSSRPGAMRPPTS